MKAILRAFLAFFLFSTFVVVTASARAEDDPDYIVLNGGVFDLVSHRTQEAEGRLEYRSGYGLFESDGTFRGFKPLVGVMANSAGGVFGYAGFAAPFAWDNDRWEFIPAAGLGAYHRGDGIDLGGTFEFHLALGLSYLITPHSRLGIAIDHISNAHIHHINPGVNSALVTWAFALD